MRRNKLLSVLVLMGFLGMLVFAQPAFTWDVSIFWTGHPSVNPASLVLATGAMQVDTMQVHSQETTVLGDPWLQKPVLPYLLLTKDPRLENETQDLFVILSLSEKEKETIRQIAMDEQQKMQSLYVGTQTIVRDEALAPADKEKAISRIYYNERVIEAMMSTDQAIQRLLGTRYSLFRSWVIDWWRREQRAVTELKQSVEQPGIELENSWLTVYYYDLP